MLLEGADDEIVGGGVASSPYCEWGEPLSAQLGPQGDQQLTRLSSQPSSQLVIIHSIEEMSSRSIT